MKQKVGLFLLLWMFFLIMSGCWGSKETDELGYIMLIGIDKGKENILEITFQLAIPQPIEGGQGEKATEAISVEAPSIFGAVEIADSFISKQLTLIHNKAIVVSEEIARDGLSKYINPLVRSREVRRTNYLLVTQGKAKQFIKENINLIFERYPSRQFDIFMSGADITGLIPDADIHKFYEGRNSPGRQPIAALVGTQKKKEEQQKEEEKSKNTKTTQEKVQEGMAYLPGEIPREGGNKIEIIGLAVFKEDRLVGLLNGEETRYYQMLTGNFIHGNFTFPDPNLREGGNEIIVIELKEGRSPEIKVDPAKEQINVRLFLEGEILSIQSGKNYEQGKLKRQLEGYVSNWVTQASSRLIRKTQEEYGSDIFGFGEFTRIDFWTWQDWINYDWLQKYPQYQVSVQTEFYVRRTGMMTETAPIH